MCEELLRGKPNNLVNSHMKGIQLQEKFSLTLRNVPWQKSKLSKDKREGTLLSERFGDEILGEFRKNTGKS